LAALVKKATQLTKKQEHNVIEPMKKSKVKWPGKEEKKEEEEPCALGAELKDFNHSNLDKLDLRDDADSDEENEDGEMDISVSDQNSV